MKRAKRAAAAVLVSIALVVGGGVAFGPAASAMTVTGCKGTGWHGGGGTWFYGSWEYYNYNWWEEWAYGDRDGWYFVSGVSCA